MAIPLHTLNIYQKPAQGSSFIARKQAFFYSHTIAAMGGFDTASCQVSVTKKEGEVAFENWLGNRVAVFVDNPAEPIWEGLINRIDFEAGGVTFSASIDSMFNRIKGVWRPSAVATHIQTAAADTTASQAIYGIKEGSVEGNLELSASATAGTARMEAMRDLLITLQAWPQVSMREGGGSNVIRLEMVGFYHTLEWENVRDTGTTDRNASVIVDDVIDGIGNGTTFFDNTDKSQIVTNAGFTTSEAQTQGETAWQVIQKATEPGSGVVRWIAGISPTGFNTGTRALYYRASNTEIEYTARLRDGMRIRNLYGGLIPPWRVRPDRGLRLNDALVGWNGLGDDPRELYVEVVRYDADRQMATVQGADDVTIEGAFQYRRYYKMHGTRNGAIARNSV